MGFKITIESKQEEKIFTATDESAEHVSRYIDAFYGLMILSGFGEEGIKRGMEEFLQERGYFNGK